MRRLAGMLATLSLVACGGSFFRSHAPLPSTYQLAVNPVAAVPGEVRADLTVLMPRVRTGLDTDHIAVLYPDRRLDYFAGARWSGPLDEVTQDLLLQAFRTYANLSGVGTDRSSFRAGYWLEVDVVDFQAEYSAAGGAPTAHVRLLGVLGTALDRQVIGRFEAQGRQPAQVNHLTAIVDAYGAAADQALQALVLQTAAVLKAQK